MGNWRTVNITGTMSAEHAAVLLDLLDKGPDYRRDVPRDAECLAFSRATPSLCGLNAWPAAEMNRSGNLAERNYSVDDVTLALQVLVHHAPSMLLKVHCGGEYESDECVATVSVGEGLVVVGKPEREEISGIPDSR
jgi:hypothetical protein